MKSPDTKLFRFRNDFKRDAQIALCATSIESVRTHLGSDWHELLKPVAERAPHLREARKLVKHLVRVAGESTDFYCTVDFITLPAALTVENARKRNGGKPLASHLVPSADLTHEHMVPCEVVLQELVRAPAGQPLADVLEPLSYRALVCKKKEIRALDSGTLRSALPPVSETRLAIGDASDPSIPPAFKALMRYDAAGLLGRLLPVTPRAAELQHAYMNWAA